MAKITTREEALEAVERNLFWYRSVPEKLKTAWFWQEAGTVAELAQIFSGAPPSPPPPPPAK